MANIMDVQNAEDYCFICVRELIFQHGKYIPFKDSTGEKHDNSSIRYFRARR